MGVLYNPISDKSSGGTELMCRRLEAGIPAELMDKVQIVPSRLYGELDPTKVRILYLHDLPQDPESRKILSNRGWERFHRIVCVSNWQMQRYIDAYQIPWSKMTVIPNAIEPITRTRKPDGTVRFVYHTTPHRGLDILVPVFEKLCETHDDITLDVYSSFGVYGWLERDTQFRELFDRIGVHPKMRYHGAVSNDEVRTVLAESDVFAYPSTWPETSCLALIEAMSAGLTCIHPNFGALAETAANWTDQYQFHEDKNEHAGVLHSVVSEFLGSRGSLTELRTVNQKAYADIFYNWNSRKLQWISLIGALLDAPRELPKETFHYRA